MIQKFRSLTDDLFGRQTYSHSETLHGTHLDPRKGQGEIDRTKRESKKVAISFKDLSLFLQYIRCILSVRNIRIFNYFVNDFRHESMLCYVDIFSFLLIVLFNRLCESDLSASSNDIACG